MFSIVTANWNGENLLETFLDSLTKQTFQEFVLYIVDNGSTDHSVEVINRYKTRLNIRLIELESNNGFAQANNIAIEQAIDDDSSHIITLNNDIELAENALSELYLKIKLLEKKFDVFQILLMNYYKRNVIDAAGIELDRYFFASQISHNQPIESIDGLDLEIDGACAGAGVYSKKSLQEVRTGENFYFDPTFFAYYEDVDLAIRLNNLGFKTYLVKDSVAYHKHSATSGKNSAFKEYYLARNLYYYLRKNLSQEKYHKNLIIYQRYFLKNLFKLFIKGKFKAIHSAMRGYHDSKKLKIIN